MRKRGRKKEGVERRSQSKCSLNKALNVNEIFINNDTNGALSCKRK